MSVELEVQSKMAVGGCMFPVLNKETGKRQTLCGAMTLYEDSGTKMRFCAAHSKVIANYIDAHKHSRLKGKSGTMAVTPGAEQS